MQMTEAYLLAMMNNLHKLCDTYRIVLVGDIIHPYEYKLIPNVEFNENMSQMRQETLDMMNSSRKSLLDHPKISIREYRKWGSEHAHMTVDEYNRLGGTFRV